MSNENNTIINIQDKESFNIVQNYIKKGLDKKNIKKNESIDNLSIKELLIEKFIFNGIKLSINILN